MSNHKCNHSNSNCHPSAPCKPACCVPCPPCPPSPPEPVYYSVVYEPNGGTGGAADFHLPQGSLYTLKGPEEAGVYWPGHTFTGWNTAPDGSGIFYRPGDVITLTHNLPLYAQWEITPPVTANVIYDPNGGTGGLIDGVIPVGNSYTIRSGADVNVSRPGYIFTGWNTRPDGTGTVYPPGSVTNIYQDLTLYAQWTIAPPETVDVIYNPNGGIGGLTDHGIPVNSEYTLRSPADINMSWPGYTFIGWNTKPDGTGIFYQPGDVAWITQDQVFYAIWLRYANNNPALGRPASE